MNETMDKILEEAERMLRHEHELRSKNNPRDFWLNFCDITCGAHLALLAVTNVILRDDPSDTGWIYSRKILELVKKLDHEAYEAMKKATPEVYGNEQHGQNTP